MIKLRNLYLEKFNSLNNEHYTLAKTLHNDNSVRNYISKDFISFIEKMSSSIGDEKYEILTPYVVRDNSERLLGILGSQKEYKDNVVDLWYALDPSYRNKGFGSKVLSQMTQYLIKEKYDDVMLLIDNKNIRSINLAVSEGYNEIGKKSDGLNKILVYQYFKKK